MPLLFILIFAGMGTYLIWSGYAATQQTYQVPNTIVSDCSKPVDAELNSWISSLPDNSIIQFGAGRCYGQDGTIQLTDRHNVTIDGNGSTFKALTLNQPTRSNWQVWAGGNIVIKNMIVYGADPSAGAGHPDTVNGVSYEHQHGYTFSGTTGGTLDNVQAYQLYGDGAEAQRDTRTPYRESHPSTNILIQNSHFEGTDRVVMGLTSSDGVVVRNNYIGNSNLAGVDIEPNSAYDSASNIQILNNTIADIRWEAVTLTGNGNENNIVIRGNTVPDSAKNVCKAGVRTISQAVPITNLIIDSNHFVTGFAGMRLEGIKQVLVTGNNVERSALNACGQFAQQRVGVLYGIAQDLTIKNNTFDKFLAPSQALNSSNSNILACENRLLSTGAFTPACPSSSTPAPNPAPAPTPRPNPSPSPSPAPSSTPPTSSKPAPASIDINKPGKGPAVSGTITFTRAIPGASHITYKVDGKPVSSGTIDTKQLADGRHTLEIQLTGPNGQIEIQKKTFSVNNHQPLWRNVFLRYGYGSTTAVIVGALGVIGITIWWYMFRKGTGRFADSFNSRIITSNQRK